MGISSIFVEGMPVIQIRRSNVHITFVAPESITICMSLHDFRAKCRKAASVLAEHDAKVAPVVPIKGRKGEH